MASFTFTEDNDFENIGLLLRLQHFNQIFDWVSKVLLKTLQNWISRIFVCGHYFVQYGFMLVCIFYQFFWKTRFSFLFAFRGVSKWNQCNLRKLYNNYNHCLCKYQVLCIFVLTYFWKEISRHKHLSIAFNTREQAFRKFFELLSLKNSIIKEQFRNIQKLKSERRYQQINSVKKILEVGVLFGTFAISSFVMLLWR